MNLPIVCQNTKEKDYKLLEEMGFRLLQLQWLIY
jgi:hypothetical protein